MADGASDCQDRTHMIDRLDKLIDAFFDELNESAGKHARIGDLIKMIELRQKLLPDSSNQKQFWKMIEKIRREDAAASSSPGRQKRTGPKREEKP